MIAVQVSFARATYTATEGGGTATVSLSLNKNPGRKVVVPLTVTMNGGATQDDYTGVPESITFYNDQLKKTLDVTATDDAVNDDGESLTIGFGRLPSGVSTGSHATSLINLRDNDAVVGVYFDQPTYTAEEGGAAAMVRVRLSEDATRDVTIPLTAAFEGGAAENDFGGVPEQITFARGESEKTFNVTATDDDEDDDAESLKIGFGTLPVGFDVGKPDATSVNIRDNDDPVVTVSFGQPTYEGVEGGGAVVVRVNLSVNPEWQVTIPLTATPGNGATEADYRVSPNVTFNSGETEKTVELLAVDDNVDDDGETIALGFGALPSMVTAGGRTTATVTLTDNDERGVIVSVTELAISEGDAGSYAVALRSRPTGTVTVNITGMENTDVSVDPNQLSFTSQNWNVSKAVGVRTHDDDAVADQVTLRHAASGGDYGNVVAPTVVVTVIEDEMPAMTVENQRATEGAGAMVFTVTLDIPSSEEVTVKYATSNGTAFSGEDYSPTQGTLRFAALQTRQTISVPLIDDNVDEDAETFTLTLTEPVNATLSGGRVVATGTIDDNDAAEEALEVLLSSVGRMVVTDVINVVSGRFDQPVGIEPSLTLGGLPVLPVSRNMCMGQHLILM